MKMSNTAQQLKGLRGTHVAQNINFFGNGNFSNVTKMLKLLSSLICSSNGVLLGVMEALIICIVVRLIQFFQLFH